MSFCLRRGLAVTGVYDLGLFQQVDHELVEHLALLQERFPAWAEKVEFWHIDDAPEVLGLIEREVMGLVARILGGNWLRILKQALPD